ncbi:hypothetical protein FA09DRAFT_93237 [Tilletiopsis washingtonensis]|uniref:Uncharacterized protein n=1 Tax=Tilletiopsis washingtonensis TaxID=58919 RepID=A0A316Z438_9BASI|nr:hypothetical protein FA09DRAFT_93237 [Tilletiopsis washingtonensis]PWN96146.1 hypothetical protein FA09DRAFT_93237 [Tilletiopsis washingtonensis]
MWQHRGDRSSERSKTDFRADTTKTYLTAKERCLILGCVLCWHCHARRADEKDSRRAYCQPCWRGLGLSAHPLKPVCTSAGEAMLTFGLKRAEVESLPLYREVVEWLPEWRSVYDSDHIYFRDGDPYPFYAGLRFFVATSTYDWFARRYTVLPTGVIVRADFRSRVTRVEHPDEALRAARQAGSLDLISRWRDYYRREDLVVVWKAKVLEAQRK